MFNICNFCNKEFTTSSLLKRHVKNTKYCLKLQGVVIEENVKEIKKILLECNSCFKILKSKRSYTHHLSICKALKLKIVKDLKNEIKLKNDIIEEHKKELDISNAKLDCMKEIAKEPKTKTTNINTINNKYINMVPLLFNKSDVKSRIETDFNKNHFLEGQEGGS